MSMKQAKVPTASAKPARKVTLKAVVTGAPPTLGSKGGEQAVKGKTPQASSATARNPATRKTAPAGKRQTKPASSSLKLIKQTPGTGIANGTSAPRTNARADKVRIFQIYYRPEQRQYLDPAFEPYNNEGDTNPLLEFNVFRKLMDSGQVSGAKLWGALSWKFREKTGLSGEQLRQIIAANPGHDVYYCNPFPELEALYHNLWVQGETVHPNFIILCRVFFKAAGLDLNALEELQPSQLFAAANYFIAAPSFWKAYLEFVEICIARAETNMSETAKAMIYSSTADTRGLHAGASYMPFIVERLFTYFLARQGNSFKTCKYSINPGHRQVNVHHRLLGQMKDGAINAKSLWLATCWVNYRNLLLTQTHGAAWIARYLNGITPKNLSLGSEARGSVVR